MENLLTVMLFLPALGALFQMTTRNMPICRWLALGTSVLSGSIGIFLIFWAHWLGNLDSLTFQYPWMKSYSMAYALGLDGINALVVLLIAVVFPLLIIAEWNRTNARRGTFALLLLLQFSSLGTALSQDLFLMFFFWSFSALPGYFLIGILGWVYAVFLRTPVPFPFPTDLPVGFPPLTDLLLGLLLCFAYVLTALCIRL